MATGFSSIGQSGGEIEADCVRLRSTAGHVALPMMGFVAIGYLGGEQGPTLIIGILVVKCADNVQTSLVLRHIGPILIGHFLPNRKDATP